MGVKPIFLIPELPLSSCNNGTKKFNFTYKKIPGERIIHANPKYVLNMKLNSQLV